MAMLDAVIVGAGQAGLGISYFLQRDGRPHLVLERGRIGETWLSQRWDSFSLNTPNFMNALPGLAYDGPQPAGFASRDDLVAYFDRYAERFQLPVRTGIAVTSVEQAADDGRFIVKAHADGRAEETLLSRSVVIAAGIQHTPRFPAARARIPADITQLHTAGYRSASVLPPGAVVVVGSGQSGCQIAEDLLSAGRSVYLCTSRVGRFPRRYRGRDILEWLIEMGFWDVTPASLPDKSLLREPQPQISGLGPRGHTLSLQHLARLGAVILGRLEDVEGTTLILGEDAAAHVHYGDEVSRKRLEAIDDYIAKTGITPPPPEDDPADLPDPGAECASTLRQLDLRTSGVSAIIWATGFTGDFSWIHLPAFDDQGRPIHERGISPVRGLYFVGFPWLNSRKSGILYGIAEDAGHIAAAIAQQLQ